MSVSIGSRIGNYRVLELLGGGGMGEVYLVEECGTGRRRAMKTLRSGGPESEVWQRFLNEGQLQHEVSHPNIAAFHEMFLFEDRPCLVMELVEGETLFTHIQRCGTLPAGDALRVLEQLCDALDYLHGMGIMHRDIKASNIKITPSGTVKLLDFGIARSQRSRGMTMTGMVMGTPEYLAPEQIAGLPADARTEVWALGLIAYEMLTGGLPFTADDDLELFRAIREIEPPPVATLNPAVSGSLNGIVMRCLDKRPSRRYQTASDVRAAIARAGARIPAGSLPAFQVPAWFGLQVFRARSLSPRARYLALAAPILLAVLWFALSSSSSDDVRTITVEVVEGAADVYANGSHVGRTPYHTRVRLGDPVALELRKEGYLDQPVQFEVSERKTYSYAMQPSGSPR